MKLSVIIVSYNVRCYLSQCLVSLQRALEGVEAEVYVVDNHSHDDTVSYIKENFPYVKLVASNHNYGFARANNIAIRQSEGEYVLLINPDTFVGEDVVRECVAFMDTHPNAGGVGVRMLKADGSNALESRRGLPTPLTAFYKMCGLCAKYPRSRRFGRYYMGYLAWNRPERIEIISGAYCMLRHSVLDKIGLLDEDFFMYGEDIDLSYRIIKAGYENWYLPLCILHYKGESTEKSSFRYVHVFYEAMLIFFRKHYSHTTMLINLPIKAAIFFKASFALGRMLTERVEKNLGFFRMRRYKQPLYVFVGNADVLAACRRLSKERGLYAVFFEGNEQTLPEGHLSLDIPEVEKAYIVYDIDAYSFQKILSNFALNPRSGVIIGTYDRRSGIVITPEDIIS